MEVLLAILIGSLYAAGLYMVMRRSLVKMIIGLAFLSYAVNLTIFTVGQITRGQPPLILEGQTLPTEPFADPLPQALVLTAIVIGFGLQAFAIVLIKRTYQSIGSDDIDQLERAASHE